MTIAELPFPTLSPRPAAAGRLTGLPVAIIGAGPVGLAAAAQLIERGIDVVVYEAGDSAGSAIAAWGHTRLFTPWEYLVDDAAGRMLERTGWHAPEPSGLPLGSELVQRYLLPLAATPELAPVIRYRSRVSAVSRQGMDRTRSTGRSGVPFLLRVEGDEGVSEQSARAVIDASGTWSNPNGLASSGLEPMHQQAVGDAVVPALPDVLGADREVFAGRHTVVVGAGHSAANTLLALAALAEESPGTSISWLIRGASPVRAYGSANDELAARGQLGASTHELVRRGAITLVDQFEIDDVRRQTAGGVVLEGRRAGERASIEADVVVNATGFRPDLGMLREIRLALDEIVEAPRALASLIDPNLHSCGTVSPHGVDELTHPEPDFYIAGMKSYGRAPTFLLLTGYEQVRSIADELAGNRAAARTVRLVLPETGVCNSGAESTAESTAGGGCCVAPTETVTVTIPATVTARSEAPVSSCC